jgi:hypothetical protein
LIALLGPRGLSTLLLALLPVFAGMPGADRLFAVTSLAVLISVALHGSGIAFLLRGGRGRGGVVGVAPVGAPPIGGPLSDDRLPASAADLWLAAPAHADVDLDGRREVTIAAGDPPSATAGSDGSARSEASIGGDGPARPGEVWEDGVQRIAVAQVRSRIARGEPFAMVDVRAERSYRTSDLQARAAVRLPPDDPVRAAEALRLPRDATLILYCA